MGESVERIARRRRGDWIAFSYGMEKLESLSYKRNTPRPALHLHSNPATTLLYTSSIYIEEPVRAVHSLFRRQKLSSRAPLFSCRAPLTARFCPLSAF